MVQSKITSYFRTRIKNCSQKTSPTKAQYRTGIYVDRRSIEEAEESKLSDLESCPLKCIRRVNPKLPRRPKQPPKHAPSWIEDKPISTWSELHRFDNIFLNTCGN